MKNLKFVVFVVIFFSATVCSAQVELEVSSKGEYRLKTESPETWEKTGIVAEELVMPYMEYFSEAIQNPEIEVSVEESEEILRLKPLFKKVVEVKRSFIIYNESIKKISYFELKETEETSSYLIVFALLSIVLMIISNILIKKGQASITVSAAAFAAFVAAFVAAAAATTVAAFVAAAAATTAAAAAAFVAAVDDNNKDYKVAVIIFYISMITYIVLMFLGGVEV